MDRTLEERIAAAVREPITIVDYNPNWPALFEAEARTLVGLLPAETIGRIEHFGSTAVEGMPAKPIIDMLVEILRPQDLETVVVPVLDERGYEYFWRTDVAPPYAWFIKRGADGQRTHHVHMVESGSAMWARLGFRDYLRVHAEEAAEYAELKRRLAREYPNDRVRYTEGKTGFVEGVMRRIFDIDVQDEQDSKWG